MSTSKYVCLIVPPHLDDNYPQNKTLVEGDELSLHCKVNAADPAPNITWKKFDEDGRRFNVGETLIFTANRTDEGKYRCFAENGIGDNVMSRVATVVVRCKSPLILATKPFFLYFIFWYFVVRKRYSTNLTTLITVPPQLDQRPESQVITEGETLVMKCNATGNPTPSIAWSMGAEVLPSGETLTIDNSSSSDAGTYTCTATNGVPPGTAGTATLTVNGTKSVVYLIFVGKFNILFFCWGHKKHKGYTRQL